MDYRPQTDRELELARAWAEQCRHESRESLWCGAACGFLAGVAYAVVLIWFLP